MKLIAKNVLGSSASNVEFTSIPGTGYTDLLLVISARSDRSGFDSDLIEMTFNSSTTGYSWRQLYGNGSSAASYSYTTAYVSGGRCTGAASTSSTFGNSECYIPNYAGSTNKSISMTGVGETNATTAGMDAVAGLWSNTAAITSIKLTASGSGVTFASGSSFFLFGISKA
jgi:hypothetical protein